MAVIEMAARAPFAARISRSRSRGHEQKMILPAGRIFASGDEVTVFATVGSSVAVCLWDSEAEVGGMAHYALPTTDGWEHAIRCGAGAIPALIERLVSLGGSRENMVAKIFGGARIIHGECAQGAMNVRTALETLNAANIQIVGADLEGDRARRVMFHLRDGRAWVKHL